MDPMLALLFGVVAPGGVALVLALLLGGWRRGDERFASGANAVAVATAYVVAWQLILGLPELVPVDVTQASPWFAVIGALLAWPLARMRTTARVGASAVLGVGIGVWLTSPFVPHVVASGDAIWHIAAIAATFVIFDVVLAALLRRTEPRVGAIGVALMLTGVALAVLFGNVVSLAQLVGSLAAGVGALVTLGLWRKSAANLSHATLVIAAIVTTNLWSAKLGGDASWVSVALLAAMPLVWWATSRWWSVVAPVGVAVALGASAYFAPHVALEAPAASDGYDPSYGY